MMGRWSETPRWLFGVKGLGRPAPSLMVGVDTILVFASSRWGRVSPSDCAEPLGYFLRTLKFNSVVVPSFSVSFCPSLDPFASGSAN